MRSKVDAFFDPAPGAKMSAAQMLDREGHHEDDGDHMQSFFKKGSQAAPVEVNKRSILADI